MAATAISLGDGRSSRCEYTYDHLGKVLTSKIYEEKRDIQGQGDSSDLLALTTSHTYDKNGNLKTIAYPNAGLITCTYDFMNRQTHKTRTIRNENNTLVSTNYITFAYAYFPNGNLQTQTLGNGVSSHYTYFANNRLHTLQNKQGATILEAYQYTYDGAGNMTAKVDIKGTTVYTYTPLSQLLTVTEPGGKATSYTYDGAGNRETMTVAEEGESTVTTYEVDELSRLTLETEETAEKATLYRCYYDNNGNLISKVPETLTDDRAAGAPDLSFDTRDGLALYEYNARNQLVRANVWRENGDTNEVEEELVTNTFNAQGYRGEQGERWRYHLLRLLG